MKNKKAISLMIGYVLLISVLIIISFIVYAFLRTYIPRDKLECPDGVSVYVEDISCIKIEDKLELDLTLKNDGRFSIGGYFIHATNSSEQELATIDLSKYLESGGVKLSTGVKYLGEEDNSLHPDNKKTNSFNISGVEQIYSIEITPIRWQVEENKNRLVSCGDSKISEVISCGVGCVSKTCDELDCGIIDDGCGKDLDCGPCPPGKFCDNNRCIDEITTERIDIGGKYSSLALDSNEVVHIAHYDDLDGYLRYCNNIEEDWICVRVEPAVEESEEDYLKYNSIAVDSDNIVHISHTRDMDGYDALRHCYNDVYDETTDWNCNTVSSGKLTMSSIAIDSDNKVHIASYNQTVVPGTSLIYCHNKAGSWSCVAKLRGGYYAGFDPSIAIGPDNKVHILVSSGSSLGRVLIYCNTTSGSLECTGMYYETDGFIGGYEPHFSIAADSDNIAHIVYEDNFYSSYNTYSRRLAYCNNSGWSWSCLDAGNQNSPNEERKKGQWPSIVMGENNKVHVVALDYVTHNVKHCINPENFWDCENIVNVNFRSHLDKMYLTDRWVANKKGRLNDNSARFSDFMYMSWYNTTGEDLYYTRFKL